MQDDEVSKLASQLIPGYPAQPTGGNSLYMQDLIPLDGDMSQYIHDNTEDELTHEVFINKYLESKGAETVNLDKFRTLPSSKATGANQFGRITNLTQLTVDTSWWTRYRSRTGNPDFGDTFPQAIPTLAVGQHTAIPRTDNDANFPDFFQAIVNTAGFHFAFIEQGGTSLYPMLAQTGQQPGGPADPAGHWRDRDHALPDLARQSGQCAAIDGRYRSSHGREGDLPGPKFPSVRRGGFSDEPDHAGAHRVSQ